MAILERFLAVITGVGVSVPGIYWMETRDATTHPTVHRTALKKASSSPDIRSVTVEKMLPSGMNSGLLSQNISVSNNISKARVWDP